MSAPWATLTPFGGDGAESSAAKQKDILISKDEFSVGRSKTCDVLLLGKKMISGKHFVIRKGKGVGDGDGSGDDGGTVVAELEDCSTNGTMLNLENLVKKAKVPLRDGEWFLDPWILSLWYRIIEVRKSLLRSFPTYLTGAMLQ